MLYYMHFLEVLSDHSSHILRRVTTTEMSTLTMSVVGAIEVQHHRDGTRIGASQTSLCSTPLHVTDNDGRACYFETCVGALVRAGWVLEHERGHLRCAMPWLSSQILQWYGHRDAV
jgi:hypothetical protein